LWDFAAPVTAPLTLVAAWDLLAPSIDGPTAAAGVAGETFGPYTPTVTGAEVTVTATGLPDGLDVDEATGEVTGTPADIAGEYLVTLTATNAAGADALSFTLTLERGAAASFSATASTLRPKQGDTVIITVTANDGYGNEWDASSSAIIESTIASDRIDENRVTFPHASPHILTIRLDDLPSQTLVIDVQPVTTELGVTGAAAPWMLIAIALLALFGGTAVVRARRESA
jgi:hypothetical protein